MNYINLNVENINNEHICCGFSDKKCVKGYQLKKDLIKDRFNDGFVFKKADVRHKVFIEYCPAENAWAPIIANNYNFISCFWVAGSYKGQGIGRELLESVISESKDKYGVCVIVPKKKRPFLSDKKFFMKYGFEVCDTAAPDFELLVLKNDISNPNPEFKAGAKTGKTEIDSGIVIYYSNMCPFTDYYVNEVMLGAAVKNKVKVEVIKLDSTDKAQNAPCPFTIFSIYKNGEFITNEILTEAKFVKLFVED